MDYRLKSVGEKADGDHPAKFLVSVHYEMYDGIPAMSKWITVKNDSKGQITVDRFRHKSQAGRDLHSVSLSIGIQTLLA